jgi:hypothetical protein
MDVEGVVVLIPVVSGLHLDKVKGCFFKIFLMAQQIIQSSVWRVDKEGCDHLLSEYSHVTLRNTDHVRPNTSVL